MRVVPAIERDYGGVGASILGFVGDRERVLFLKDVLQSTNETVQAIAAGALL